MKRIKKLFIIGYALFSILIIQNCKENKISFEEILTKEGVYWDLHHPEIKTVTYSYRFDKSQKVTYFFYDRDEKDRAVFDDDDVIFPKNWEFKNDT